MEAGLFHTGVLLQVVEPSAAPSREEGQETKIARLQTLLRVEKVLQEFFVLGNQFFVTVEGGSRFMTQLFELVADAFFGASDGALDGGIHFGDRLM